VCQGVWQGVCVPVGIGVCIGVMVWTAVRIGVTLGIGVCTGVMVPCIGVFVGIGVCIGVMVRCTSVGRGRSGEPAATRSPGWVRKSAVARASAANVRAENTTRCELR